MKFAIFGIGLVMGTIITLWNVVGSDQQCVEQRHSERPCWPYSCWKDGNRPISWTDLIKGLIPNNWPIDLAGCASSNQPVPSLSLLSSPTLTTVTLYYYLAPKSHTNRLQQNQDSLARTVVKLLNFRIFSNFRTV